MAPAVPTPRYPSYFVGKYDPFLSRHCTLEKSLQCDDSCLTITTILRNNGNGSSWTIYYESVADIVRANGLEDGAFVEIGIGHGGLPTHMLSSFPRLKYHSVDPFLSGCDDTDAMSNALKTEQDLLGLSKAELSVLRGKAAEYMLSAEAEPCPARFTFHHRTSTAAASQFLRESVNIVFIDGLHTLQGVENDIEAWLFVLKPDGLMMFNDYGTDFSGVIAAVDSFAARLNTQVVDMQMFNVYVNDLRVFREGQVVVFCKAKD